MLNNPLEAAIDPEILVNASASRSGRIAFFGSFATALVLAGLAWPGTAASAEMPPSAPAPLAASRAPPFTATLSNTTPLVFGMSVGETADALGVPLTYVSGKPGHEIYLAIQHLGGSGLFPHNDRLYLQFRKGQLTGWKGDWGHYGRWP